MLKISVVIITLNEERNIMRALRSVEGIADEVVVLDSGSTDRTVEICRDYGAKVFHKEWLGYAAAKNHANRLASNPWILSLDADEALTEELRHSITAQLNKPLEPSTVFSFNRLTNYCGHWIRHSGWYPDRKIRIWHRDVGQWEGDIHEVLVFTGSPERIHLAGDLLHYSFPTKEDYLRQQRNFARLSAESMYRRGKRGALLKVWFAPAVRFVRDYFFRLGFLDGRVGFEVCRLTAGGVLMKYRMLHQMQTTARR